jgi:selenocysteine-specific elongation factor
VAQAPNLGRWVVDDATLDAARADLAQRVDDAGPLGLDIGVLDERQRAVLASIDSITIDGTRARPVEAADPLADHPYLAALTASPFQPPPPDGVPPAEVRELVKRNLVIEHDGIHFAPSAVSDASVIVAALLRDRPDGITVAELRDALGTTRKYLLPLLGILDGSGVTRRRGDLRVGGPRLPS